MAPALCLAALCVLQVPPPNAAEMASRALHAEFRSILGKERAELEGQAVRLESQGKKADASDVRSLNLPDDPSGPIRFRPLPEYVPAAAAGAPKLPAGVVASRKKTARALVALAGRAAAPSVHRFALADRCLRAAIERDPDQPEARRLLGFLPLADGKGWATPHAAELLKKGYVLHPKFDWVLADWLPHLDHGQLPGEFSASGRPLTWLPDADADALRADYARGWQIKTAPHFEIQTNVSLAETIAFGRRLEGLHGLFLSQFADVIGAERLPLAHRFAKPNVRPVANDKKFGVSYFARRDEYVAFLKTRFGLDEKVSLGYYMPPFEAKRYPRTQPRSYFYRDLDNPIAAHATLYHEASHQILFETAGKSSVEQARSNYWIWEGLGTYFETVDLQDDGSLFVGGLVGPRIEQARELLVGQGKYVPLDEFTSMDKREFGDLTDDVVFRNYAQAMALTVFFLHGQGQRYREPFLDYVADAYRGKVRPDSLEKRLGVAFKTLDEEFLAYLK